MLKPPRIHILLFILTVITTTIAGAEWINGKSFILNYDTMGWAQFKQGLWFSVPFLGFLTSHEFGHYFMAKIRKIRVTLPYYIPGWLGIFTSIGTFGAFIKIEEKIKFRNNYFDVGIAGPLAGFIVTLGILIFGFLNLPGDDFIYSIHPEYKEFPGNYRAFLDQSGDNPNAIIFGKSLLYSFLEQTFANPDLIPHPHELSHYPVLLAGFLGLLFTALNLLPIGQLDGGHIMFSLIGKKRFDIVSPIFLIALVFYSGLGMFKINEFTQGYAEEETYLLPKFLIFIYFNYLVFSRIFPNKISNLIIALSVVLGQLLISKFFPHINGYQGFLAFGFLIGRVLGVYHPSTEETQSLDWKRTLLGWIAILIFILSFSPNPIN